MTTNWRGQFPFFAAHPGLAYLDSAATSQKPTAVLTALQDYYVTANANVHRGLYHLAYDTTEQYEAIREQVAAFVNAPAAADIVFTRGTTDSLNMVAQGFGEQVVQAGDEILVSGAEHHSNFIPWQQLAKRTGAKFVVAPVTAAGDTDPVAMAKLITPRTKLVALAAVTNVTGGPVPVAALATQVHANGGYLVVDGAQEIPHRQVDVQAEAADFYAFSGHKVFGPTGIGVLYGRAELLAVMQPVAFGGEMIDTVQDETTTWAEVPLRFEAGTPNIAGVFGLGAALTWLDAQDREALHRHEAALVAAIRAGLGAIPEITLYGSDDSVGIVSFNLQGVHPHDLATYLDEQNVAVRAGHHCAQPLMARLGIPATCRTSVGPYNDEADVAQLVAAVAGARRFFHGFD